MKKNTPYVKKYVNGILVNPITKETPYLNSPHVSYLKMFQRANERWSSKYRRWEFMKNKFFIGKTIVKC